MFTNWLGIDCSLYATFDGDLGTITIPSLYYAYLGADYGTEEITNEDGSTYEADLVYYYYTFAYYSVYYGYKTGIVFDIHEPGVISSWDDYIGWYYDSYFMPESGNEEDITNDDQYGYDYDMYTYRSNIVRSDSEGVSLTSLSKPFELGLLKKDFVRK